MRKQLTTHIRLHTLSLIVALTAFSSMSANASIVLRFEGNRAIAQGISPGASAVFFMRASQPSGYHSVIVRFATVQVDDNMDGIIALDTGNPIPPRSIWAVVDTRTGEYVVDTPDGYPRREIAFPGHGIGNGDRGQFTRLEHQKPWIDALVVRPGLGCWMINAKKNGKGDDDRGRPDRFGTALEEFEPVMAGAAPSPRRFEIGDVIIAIDPLEMQFYSTRLGRLDE